MANRKYNRIFVLMTGKNGGQSLNGSCDMEVINGKGRLYAYVGKLSKLTNKPKKLYLISVGIMGTMAVSAGNLQQKGRNATIMAEFDPNNLFGSGMMFEEINAVAIWGEDDGPNNAALEGFVSKRLNWHTNLDIFGETTKAKIQQVQQAEEIKYEPIEPKDKVEESVMEKTEKLYRNALSEPETTAVKSEENENIDKLKEPNESETINEFVEPNEPENINKLEKISEPENLNELEEIKEESKEPPTEVIEEVKEEVKENVSEIAQKLADNINEASKLKDMTAAEAVASLSPHDTFRIIAQKFRRELDMLDEMGIIDKNMFLDDEQTEKSNAEEATVSKETDTTTEEKAEPPAGTPAELITEIPPEPSEATPTEPLEKTPIEPLAETIIDEDDNIKNKADFDKMTPTDRLFVTNDKLVTNDGREWVKIDYREAYFINDAIRDIRCLFVKNAVRKGRHMIIGRDGRSMYIGVPGKEKDRTYAEQSGFYDFLRVGNAGKAGYWIKAI